MSASLRRSPKSGSAATGHSLATEGNAHVTMVMNKAGFVAA